MRLPSLSRRQKASLAVAIALLLWLPTSISTQTQPVVTGHSVFYNGDGYDPCLASIAGIIRNRVMWFNDQVLVETYGGKGTFIYVTEHNGTDPRPENSEQLYTDGTFYDFVDPNGVHWHVEEDYLAWGDITVHKDDSKPTNDYVSQHNQRQYVWIVELAPQPIHDQFAGAPDSGNYHDIYNFLVLVDTCKMSKSQLDTRSNDPDPASRGLSLQDNGTLVHDTSCNCLSAGYGHPADGAFNHTHKVFLADLYIGTAPNAIPDGVSAESAQYTSSWATSNNGSNLTRTENYAQNSPGTYADSTGAADGSPPNTPPTPSPPQSFPNGG